MDPFNDYVEDSINDLSDEFRLSRCEASGIVARLLNNELIIPPHLMTAERLRILESHVLAKCFGDNEYLFRRL